MAKKDAVIEPIDPAEYPHQTPRWLHGPKGTTRLVQDADECAAALTTGWYLRPDQVPA